MPSVMSCHTLCCSESPLFNSFADYFLHLHLAVFGSPINLNTSCTRCFTLKAFQQLLTSLCFKHSACWTSEQRLKVASPRASWSGVLRQTSCVTLKLTITPTSHSDWPGVWRWKSRIWTSLFFLTVTLICTYFLCVQPSATQWMHSGNATSVNTCLEMWHFLQTGLFQGYSDLYPF